MNVPDINWHKSITLPFRNHITRELVLAIQSQSQNKRTPMYINLNAKIVERDIYDRSNSRSEYYRLIAENIYKFHK